jgi:hypothetical protein
LSLCSIAAILGVILYHATTGFDTRYLLSALPPTMLLLPAGMHALTAPFGHRPAAAVIATLVTLGLFAATIPNDPPRQPLGYDQVARLIRDRAGDAQVLLVSSDAMGEGAFVAAVAELGPRPKQFALRAIKLVAETTWYGSNYRMLYNSPAEMQKALATVPVEVLVVDEAQPLRFPHQQLIIDTIRANPATWELLGRVTPGPGNPATRPISVYRQRGISPDRRHRIELNLKYTRGGNLVLQE